MLLDKGYYDYDYEKPKKKKGSNVSKGTDPAKLKAKLARFGINTAPKPLTAEEAQRIAREEIMKQKEQTAQ